MLTEQVEAERNRVNVGDGGVLPEPVQHFDEPRQFKKRKEDVWLCVQYTLFKRISQMFLRWPISDTFFCLVIFVLG
mgnify:CR=1 FL=1